MEFFRRADARPSRLAVFPGTFNPVTVAHIGLARAAQRVADEVVFVLPRVFPHKHYEGASFDQRVAMLLAATVGEPAFSVAASERGLFAEIAAECRAAYGPGARLSLLCGQDAAERIAGWNYGSPGAFCRMLREFDLLVAARHGEFAPAPEHAHAVEPLELEAGYRRISASEVRQRIARGEPFEELVPAGIAEMARRIYGASCRDSG